MDTIQLLGHLTMVCSEVEEDVLALLGVPDPRSEDQIMVQSARAPDEVAQNAFIGQSVGAMATRVSWSPDERDFAWCWAVVAVEAGHPAIAVVGPYEGEWYPLQPVDFPWFLAATAASIRRSVELGLPLGTVKATVNPKLMDPVREGRPPPTDENGMI